MATAPLASPRADLIVVGGGPAGTAAAITAVEHGLRVTLFDKARFPRAKTCGDGITTGALRALERLGVPAGALGAPSPAVREAVVRAPDGRAVVFPLPTDGIRAAVVPRERLDAVLVERAAARGVRVHTGATVIAIDAIDSGETSVSEVRCSDGTAMRAPWIVAADGHYSTVRKLAQPGDATHRGEWHAARRYYEGVDDDRLWVLFDADLVPGYAWSFPLGDGTANVGLCVPRVPERTGRDYNALWSDVLTRASLVEVLGTGARPAGPTRAWPIPARFDASQVATRNVLFAGDAAGVVDPMTGEGIAQALESGMLAGELIAAGGPRTAIATSYRRALDRAIGRDLQFAATLRNVLRYPSAANAAVRIAGLTAWTRRNFARWLFEDYPRAMLLTPDRWRRGMFTGPGAYRAPAA